MNLQFVVRVLHSVLVQLDKFNFFHYGGYMPKTIKKYDGFTVMLEPLLIREILDFASVIKSTRGQLMRKWIIDGFHREKKHKNIS